MPATNAFLILNLGKNLKKKNFGKIYVNKLNLFKGCEMLYVIEQRLKAQDISLEKSAQGN